jgi:hypothetical protein
VLPLLLGAAAYIVGALLAPCLTRITNRKEASRPCP